jgi:thioredoxin 1
VSESVNTVSDEDFESAVLGADIPVLVDFWAEWCTPCHIVSPIVEEIAREHAGTMKVVKLNVDDSPVVTQRYAVMSIPTLMLFKGGEAMARLAGARGKDAILKEIQAHVAA